MLEPNLLIFIRRLNEAGIRYMVSGGVAAILYGEPRLTNDVDLVVFLRPTDMSRLRQVFPDSEFYIPPEVVIADAVAQPQNGQFNLVHHASGYKADFYTVGRDDLNAWGLRNSRKLEVSGEPMIVAPPEYVIVRKLEYYRDGGSDKHLRDIRSMFTISGTMIKRSVVADWVRQRGLETEWNKVQIA